MEKQFVHADGKILRDINGEPFLKDSDLKGKTITMNKSKFILNTKNSMSAVSPYIGNKDKLLDKAIFKNLLTHQYSELPKILSE
mgnify:CR=1 FL=1